MGALRPPEIVGTAEPTRTIHGKKHRGTEGPAARAAAPEKALGSPHQCVVEPGGQQTADPGGPWRDPKVGLTPPYTTSGELEDPARPRWGFTNVHNALTGDSICSRLSLGCPIQHPSLWGRTSSHFPGMLGLP